MVETLHWQSNILTGLRFWDDQQRIRINKCLNTDHDSVSHLFLLGYRVLGVKASRSVLAARKPVKAETVLFVQPCKVTTLKQCV